MEKRKWEEDKKCVCGKGNGSGSNVWNKIQRVEKIVVSEGKPINSGAELQERTRNGCLCW